MSSIRQTVSILIVDDEKADRLSTRHECQTIFASVQNAEPDIEEAASIDEALRKITDRTFHIILLDKDLGRDANGAKLSGVDYIAVFKEYQPHAQVFMITGDESYKEIVSAIKNGASDYFLKTNDPEKSEYRSEMLRRAFSRSSDDMERTLERVKRSKTGLYAEFVCKSPVMQRLDQKLRAIAESGKPVLILGETGLGKGAIARRLNQFRAEYLGKTGAQKRPFVNINIGAMPDALAQSELFGQDAYSFTGSGSKMKPGLLDLAKGGDIFLDEVGDSSPDMQLKLLKVIEEKEYQRVGGRQAIPTTARFIFATNKNIQQLIEQGKFRNDLYMRMQAFEIEVPPLEQRKEDLPDIVESALKNALAETKDKAASIADFPDELMKFLTRDNIKGNIRGIENDVQKLVSFCNFSGGRSDFKDWKNVLGSIGSVRRNRSRLSFEDLISSDAEFLSSGFPGYKEAQTIFERRLIEEALAKTNGNMMRAASKLKIARSTMSQKVKSLNIKVPREDSYENRST